MNEKSTLFLPRLPARLDVNQASEILGFLPHEMPLLLKTGLLKPLGKPASLFSSAGFPRFWLLRVNFTPRNYSCHCLTCRAAARQRK